MLIITAVAFIPCIIGKIIMILLVPLRYLCEDNVPNWAMDIAIKMSDFYDDYINLK